MSFDLFAKGGPVMYLLAALSVYVLAVILFKAYQFTVGSVTTEDVLEEAMEDIRAQRFEKAKLTLTSIPGPVAEVARAALAAVQDRDLARETREKEVQRVGAVQLRILESHLRGLDLVANIGPLLGLLGTVIGMVNAFSRLQQQGARIDPSQLAGGIWEALLTTVGGLAVAIPALAAYYVLDGIIERVRGRMKDVSVRILSLDDVLAAAERRQEAAHDKGKQEPAAIIPKETKPELKAETTKPDRFTTLNAAQKKG